MEIQQMLLEQHSSSLFGLGPHPTPCHYLEAAEYSRLSMNHHCSQCSRSFPSLSLYIVTIKHGKCRSDLSVKVL